MKTSKRHQNAVSEIRNLKELADFRITRVGIDWPDFITLEIIKKFEDSFKDRFDLWWGWVEAQLKIIEKG